MSWILSQLLDSQTWLSLFSGLVGSVLGAGTTLAGVTVNARIDRRRLRAQQEDERKAVLDAIALDVHDQGPLRGEEAINKVTRLPAGTAYVGEFDLLNAEPNLLTVFGQQIFRMNDKALIAKIVRYYIAEQHAKRCCTAHKASLHRFNAVKAEATKRKVPAATKQVYQEALYDLVDKTDDLALRLARWLHVGRELAEALPYVDAKRQGPAGTDCSHAATTRAPTSTRQDG